MELRPYQVEVVDAVHGEWDKGIKNTLFVLPTGCGKTIVFSKIASDCVRDGERVLIMAHRGELLEQARDKIYKSQGLRCSLEKAESSCLDGMQRLYRIVVGSVQSLQSDKRLNRFPTDYFDTIIVDEAHHVLSNGYQKVMKYFSSAKVLGVTATPDRGDMRNLGTFFESLAYEYKLTTAIKEGYLSPMKAMTIPLDIDLSHVSMQNGDFRSSEIDDALDPFLYQIAQEMKKVCMDRKTVVFLPLIKTSQKFTTILNQSGFRATEVNGSSKDRAEVLKDFENGKYNVLCNSMLLTEGWDCPSVDCIIVLRPTKVRSLYTQMIGRGCRLAEGKNDLLILDFLWHTERHELCHPANLICENEEVAKAMTERMKDGKQHDIEEVEEKAKKDVILKREEALAKQLAQMKKRKRQLVDPLQFEMSIQAEDLSDYVPTFGWQSYPATAKQLKALEKFGIYPDEIENQGKAALLLDRLQKRKQEGLSTPRQIRLLEGRGFKHVGTWQFTTASNMIARIAANGWHIPNGIIPEEYVEE